MTTLNKKQAVEQMVNGFNAVKQSLIAKAYPYCDGFYEITPQKIYVGDTVDYVGDEFDLVDSYDLKVVKIEDKVLVLELTNEDDIEEYGEKIEVYRNECEWEENDYRDGWLPMWGWLWTVDSCTERWIYDNLEKMADLGFRIYEDEEAEIFIGIDGAGYDFYEAHWTPLYDAMGLQWHK